jgi:DNA-binding NtrC family response regulator
MAGRDLVRLLRGLTPDLPVVMTTGDLRQEVEVESRQLGLVPYLHKPFDVRRLEAVAARTLATSRARAARAAGGGAR